MSITLPTVRYFGPNDPYHYSVDNRPLYDLAAGQAVLKDAIQVISSALTSNPVGTWSNISGTGTWPQTLNIDLSAKLGMVWCVKFTLWACQSTSSTIENSTFEYVVTGRNIGGVISADSPTKVDQVLITSSSLTPSLSFTTSITNNLSITLVGYTGNSFSNMSCVVL